MGWSFRVARIAGIEVRIHVTFLLLLGWIAFAYYGRGGAPAAAMGLLFVCVLFGCVLLHEFGHAIAALRYGIKTPDITLLPIGGIARLQRMPDKPLEELVVAVAGPLVNVVIAAAITVGVSTARHFNPSMQLDDPSAPMLLQIRNVNIWLVLFNLIPAFPMDGGRVLRALLATRLPYARATQIAAGVGQFMAFAFAFWGLYTHAYLLLFIALFVYMGAAQEAAATQMRELTRHSKVAHAMMTRFRTLPAEATLADAADALLAGSQRDFPVADATGAIVGVLTRDALIAGLKERGPAAPVASAIKAGVQSIPLEYNLEDAFRIINDEQLPAVMVMDDTGKSVGMITPDNVAELMMIQSALDRRATMPAYRAGDPHAPQEVKPATT